MGLCGEGIQHQRRKGRPRIIRSDPTSRGTETLGEQHESIHTNYHIR